MRACPDNHLRRDSATVTTESVRAIQFNGDSSRVSYSSGRPLVTENGEGNRAVRS